MLDSIKKKSLNLVFKPLAPCLVLNNFIKNFESNYEEYLTEFINHSQMVCENRNIPFTINKFQSNKECDIENGFYQLDFKLFADKTSMENIRLYSMKIEIDDNNVVGYRVSDKEGKIRNVFLKGIVKNMKKEDFEYIENKKMIDLNVLQKKAKLYLNKITVDKNVLYFLPFNFFYVEQNMDIEKYKMISEKFSDDLKGFMEYRNSKVNRDTFLGFISCDKFIMLKFENRFKLYDVVDISVSKKFMELIDLKWF